MTLYTDISDTRLLALIKRDDHMAFTELYNRYWDKLFAVAFNRMGNEHDAEEVVQDVFFSFWKRRANITLQHQLSTYLSVAIRYQIINRLAKQHTRKKYIESLKQKEEAYINSTDLWLNEKELLTKLEACVTKLPTKCRLVFELSRKEGKSTKEIAETLNIAEKTVEAHMSKALMTLRESLQISLPLLLSLLGI